MLELLNQLDGFDSRGDVKVCPASHVRLPSETMCHNRSIGHHGNEQGTFASDVAQVLLLTLGSSSLD